MRLLSLLTRDRPDEELRPAIRHPRKAARVLAAAAIVAGIVVLAAPRFKITPIDIPAEGPIKNKVTAEFAFRVEDPGRREALLREKLNAVGKVYVYDGTTTEAMARDIQKLVEATDKFERENESKRPEDRAPYAKLGERLLNDPGVRLTSSTLHVLSGEIRSPGFSRAMNGLFEEMYRKAVLVDPQYAGDRLTGAVRVRDPAGRPLRTETFNPSATMVYPEEVRRELLRHYLPRFYPLAGVESERELRDALLVLALRLARPNLRYSPPLTEAAEYQAHSEVGSVFEMIEKGETLIPAGTVPNAFQRRAVEEYNQRIRRYRTARLLACLVLALAMLFFLALYARRFRPVMGFRTKTIVLVGIPLLVVLAVGKLAVTLLGGRYGGPAEHDPVGYLFPAALIGMLGVILLDAQLGIVLVLIGSVFVGLAMDMSLHHALVALCGGVAGVVSLYHLRQRGQVFRAGGIIGLVNVTAIAVLGFIEDPTRVYFPAVVWGTVNALLCYFLAIGTFPLFESVFGITTDLKLLELTGVHHPLIRQIEENAPGTYQHSLNVAKLAEAAADAIGANYLLVRAGAHFHDAGKALKPRYFSENQISLEERRTHEKLTPYMSCLVIRNHVKDGIELARDHGLPEQVVDFIPQHHGTCLIKYFYHEAIRQYEESESAEPVREEDFRYPGPKPQTIEAAIVMVADSVEATATSRLNRPRIDEDDIRRLVMDAIQDKFSDGQFDDCHLTLRQLHEIRKSMVRTLVGRFHHRIDYPAASAGPVKKTTREPAVV